MASSSFTDLCKLPYKDQAIFFMNGFWGSIVTPDNADLFWRIVSKFVELDKMSSNSKGAQGNSKILFSNK
jgi:hypothetical protein